MSAKKTPPTQQPNVIIPPADDSDDSPPTTTTDTMTQPTFKTFPAPTEKAGKGKKYCPTCNAKIGARSTVCENCNHEFVKGAKSAGTKNPKANSNSASSKSPTHKPEERKTPIVALLEVLKYRGWEVSGTRDIFDPTAPVKYSVETKVQPLLEYVSHYNANGKFELSIDELCGFLKIPLEKEKK